jgi:hypothetical protein
MSDPIRYETARGQTTRFVDVTDGVITGYGCYGYDRHGESFGNTIPWKGPDRCLSEYIEILKIVGKVK